MRRSFLLMSFSLSCAAPQAGGRPTAEPEAPAVTQPSTSAEDDAPDDADKWDVTAPPGDWGWRDVAIDTTEGTWISVDVSPDGSTLVFDLLGDIYALPISGGDAEPLIQGLAWHMQPRFSPDGSKIAFTSDQGAGDNIWVMNADGSEPRQVTEESFRLVNNPAWDPTGQYIVAKKHFTSKRSLGAGEMWLYHVSGGEGVQMTERPTEQKDVNDPAFSPDGAYLYYDRDATPGRFFEYNKDSSKQIYVIERLERSTGEISRVTGGPGGAARPTPSPDGTKLAFVRRVDYATTLFIRDLESGEETPVVSDLERDNQEIWALHGVYPAMAWTPDSKTLIFWDDGAIKRLDVATRTVKTIPFRVRTTKQVAEVVRPKQEVFRDTFDVKMLRHVVVSPGGDRVAYVALGQIWLRDLPDGAPRRLTTDSSRFEMFPSFTRDGASVVYATWSDDDLGDVRRTSVRGGKTRVLTREPGHYVRPSVSPDGAHVVYERVGAGYLRDPRYSTETGVFRLRISDGAEDRITSDGSMPHYGARSDRLYFMRASGDETSDTRTLVRFDFDTRRERDLYTSEAAQSYLVSPNARWLAFRERFQVFVTPFVESGRTIPIGPKAKGLPVARVAKRSGDYLSWSGDSAALHWATGPELLTRELTDAFAFLEGAPEELPEPEVRGVTLGFEATADRPRGAVVLSGARIITMNGDEVIEDGVVVTRDHRIAAIGPADAVATPEDAVVFDVTGTTIVPGFIDAHAHGAQATAEIIPQANWQHYANLAFGVTTIHDPSNQTDTIFSVSELQRAGLVRSPRTFSTGKIIYGAAGAEYKAEIESLDDAIFHLRRMKAVGGFSVKSYNQPRRDQRQMVLEAARQLEMQVMPEGGATLMHNLTMLVDGHTTIEHNLPVETLYDDVLQLWASSDVASTPTLGVAYGGIMGENYWYQTTDVWKHERLATFVPHYVLHPRARRRVKAPEGDYNHIQASKNLKALADRGRLVNTGAHGQLAGLAEHWEIWMLEQGGMTPLEALRCATINPARTLGMDAEIGSLEVGKLADLVVLDDNPLASIRNTDSVRMVMLNGRLFDAATMNQIAPDRDTAGSQAFSRGRGIGSWWGAEAMSGAEATCSCGAGATN